jgi:hypothetical protein
VGQKRTSPVHRTQHWSTGKVPDGFVGEYGFFLVFEQEAVTSLGQDWDFFRKPVSPWLMGRC